MPEPNPIPPPMPGAAPQPLPQQLPNLNPVQPASRIVPPTGTEPPQQLERSEKLSLLNLLNKIKCDNIVLTGPIGLGDALSRLAIAISRSGVRFDENGNPTQKEVNKQLGKLLQETLFRIPRAVDVEPAGIGYDPTRPMFYEGEALSIPINAEMVMLLPLKGQAPVFPNTEDDSTPTQV